MNKRFSFQAIVAKQSAEHTVLSFAAKASDILKFSTIDRIGRDDDGILKGFQRPQVSKHIHEIRDYLKSDDAVLPNPIVVAFTEGTKLKHLNGSYVELTIDVSGGIPGFIVDGQQRLSALSDLEDKNFEVFVSALICRDEAELRKQFILINNTKPLSKSLIFELLPTVDGLPARLSSKAMASRFTESLNFDETSSLHGLIKLYTYPDGIIAETSIQKVVMESLANGACRELLEDDPDTGFEKATQLISEFFAACAETFPEAWHGQTAKSSRLLHGAGIVAMGYVMEYLYARSGSSTKEQFKEGLRVLVGNTAWTSGGWEFGPDAEDRWRWNEIQNLSGHIMMLTSYLIQVLKHGRNPYATQPQLALQG